MREIIHEDKIYWCELVDGNDDNLCNKADSWLSRYSSYLYDTKDGAILAAITNDNRLLNLDGTIFGEELLRYIRIKKLNEILEWQNFMI